MFYKLAFQRRKENSIGKVEFVCEYSSWICKYWCIYFLQTWQSNCTVTLNGVIWALKLIFCMFFAWTLVFKKSYGDGSFLWKVKPLYYHVVSFDLISYVNIFHFFFRFNTVYESLWRWFYLSLLAKKTKWFCIGCWMGL